MENSIKEKVRAYFQKALYTDKDSIKDDTLIFRQGLLDSMAFIVLITFLEEEFKIGVKDSDLIEENYESINAITLFIKKKLGTDSCAELRA